MESDINDSSPGPSQGSTSSSPGMATSINNGSTEQCDSTSASLVEDNYFSDSTSCYGREQLRLPSCRS